jgi:anti-sigma B factor antagonist
VLTHEPEPTDDDGGTTVRWEGEIDARTYSRFAAALDRAAASGRRPVRVDLSGVTFIDSAGLRALIRAHQRNPLQLVSPSAQVRSVLDLTGLSEYFAATAS